MRLRLRLRRRQDLASCSAPVRLTDPAAKQRFADYVLDAPRGRLIAVCEDHSAEGQEAVNSIAAIGAPAARAHGHGCVRVPVLRMQLSGW